MQNNILDQGLTLMLVGMGTVFTFLAVLVVAMSGMSFIIKRLTPSADSTDTTDEEIAAISGAISQHRRR
jgi:oxaloacetate decarboxylase gamma subunit